MAVGRTPASGVTFERAWPFWALMRLMTPILLALLAVAAGVGLPIQAGMNVRLRELIGHPFRASALQFVVGATLLLLLSLSVRAPWPSAADIARAPWWAWTGGALGAFYVLSTIVLVPRLGGALTFALVVAGQMIAALAIDRFGFFGTAPMPITLTRVAGALMLVGAVVLIRR